jgi:adenylate cyclase
MKKFSGRIAVALGIALLASAAALVLGLFTGKADDFFYDTFYRLRPATDMRDAEVVLVAVDDPGLAAFKKPWPLPRTVWGDICTYLDNAGAKVIAFDIVFPNPSYYGDDPAFAAAMAKVRTPVIFGAAVKEDGSWEEFAPPIEGPTHGAVNLGTDVVYRAYPPELNGQSSLAEITALKAGSDLKMIIDNLEKPFLLHYYGPHRNRNDSTTFRYVNAYNVWYAQTSGPAGEKEAGISPEMFKGKIVVVCAIARAAFDLKSSPYSGEYPGPEIQATAIENILRGQQVHLVPWWGGWMLTALGAAAAALGVILPRQATLKIIAPVMVAAVVLVLCIALFRGPAIQWLSPVRPLLAVACCAPLAFGFTYFAEDRQRRFMLKALSKVVSPAIADELARNPERLALGTTRREITILFTDVAGFTDLSEGMDVQDLGKFINRYLGEMSAQVFRNDGTLDKYIGDAVMAFWNAPIPQADHAQRACRAALAMVARERELQEEFAALGTKEVYTRIGIHTSPAAVGFIGSEHLFNYTAMGDGVNLASRMEGANKIYGTQILITEPTAMLVKDAFLLRKVDVLRVKGKKMPMAVYEVMAERGAWHRRPADGAVPSNAALRLETAEHRQDADATPEHRQDANGTGEHRQDANGTGEHRQDADATAERVRLYEEALGAYQKREWENAQRLLLELSQRFGQDGPAEVLQERIHEFLKNPPPPDWDGVHVSKSK